MSTAIIGFVQRSRQILKRYGFSSFLYVLIFSCSVCLFGRAKGESVFTEDRLTLVLGGLSGVLLRIAITATGYSCVAIGGVKTAFALLRGDDNWYVDLLYSVVGVAILGGLYGLIEGGMWSTASISGDGYSFALKDAFLDQKQITSQVSFVCKWVLTIAGGVGTLVGAGWTGWKFWHGEIFVKALLYSIISFSVLASAQFGFMTFSPSATVDF